MNQRQLRATLALALLLLPALWPPLARATDDENNEYQLNVNAPVRIPGKIAALPEPAGTHHAGVRCLKGVATGEKEKENVSQRNRLF